MSSCRETYRSVCGYVDGNTCSLVCIIIVSERHKEQGPKRTVSDTKIRSNQAKFSLLVGIWMMRQSRQSRGISTSSPFNEYERWPSGKSQRLRNAQLVVSGAYDRGTVGGSRFSIPN